MLEKAVLEAVGPIELKNHFMIMDTICDATQERQDAVSELVNRQEQVCAPTSLKLFVRSCYRTRVQCHR